MNKARITYKFDPSAKGVLSDASSPDSKLDGPSLTNRVSSPKNENVVPLFREEYEVIRDKPLSAPLNQYVQDFGAWQSPYDAETARIEKLIRETGIPLPAISASNNQTPLKSEEEIEYNPSTGYFRIDPTPLPDPENPVISDKRTDRTYLRRTQTSWHKITLSVAGAVATGALLGFFVLSLFSGTSPFELFNTDKQSDSIEASQLQKGKRKARTGSKGRYRDRK